MSKLFCLLCLAILKFQPIFASEKTLLGVVLDANSQSPVEYANILILDKDSTYLNGCMSGNNGDFIITEIPSRAAMLKISFIGYRDAIYKFDELDLKQKNVFYLHPAEIVLEEVSVIANSQPFTIKDDRLIFNPSFVAYAVNANDIIRQAPGVMDTGTSLIMPGKDAVKVYINGKEQKGSLNDVLLLLKSYPSSDVESVEVMTNPSTRYTMGRNVGVVHVKLKKKPNDYLGGNAAYAFAYNTRARNEGSIGIFYQGKRLTTSLNTAGNFNKYDLKEKNTIDFSDYSRSALTDMTRNVEDLVLRWNLNYQINDDWNVGLSAFYENGKMKQNTNQKYSYSYIDGKNKTEIIDGFRTDKSNTYFASFDLGGKLSKISDLTVTVDYYQKGSSTERTLNSAIDEELIVYSLNDIQSSNITAKANINIEPNSKLNLNFGFDGIFTESESEEAGVYEDGIIGNGTFKYNENEIDLYGEARYKFNPKWMLRGSLRYQSAPSIILCKCF